MPFSTPPGSTPSSARTLETWLLLLSTETLDVAPSFEDGDDASEAGAARVGAGRLLDFEVGLVPSEIAALRDESCLVAVAVAVELRATQLLPLGDREALDEVRAIGAEAWTALRRVMRSGAGATAASRLRRLAERLDAEIGPAPQEAAAPDQADGGHPPEMEGRNGSPGTAASARSERIGRPPGSTGGLKVTPPPRALRSGGLAARAARPAPSASTVWPRARRPAASPGFLAALAPVARTLFGLAVLGALASAALGGDGTGIMAALGW